MQQQKEQRMVTFRFALVLFIAVAVFLNCGGSDPVSYPVIAVEQWRLNDQGTSSYADMTFAKNSNNAVTASGKWYYFFGLNSFAAFMPIRGAAFFYSLLSSAQTKLLFHS
ncbi:MAG: hypothetical protein MUF22_09785, partial [Chitinispirillaceae bacterium]|nr:hypothetical protein [Chitinispirillaceae bacterium]